MDSPKDIAKAVTNFVLNRNDQLAQERLDICQECPMFHKIGLCSLCGCAMAVKVRNEGLHCPINKW